MLAAAAAPAEDTAQQPRLLVVSSDLWRCWELPMGLLLLLLL
jgi:hypothetical protein